MRAIALLLCLASCAPVGPLAQIDPRSPWPELVPTGEIVAAARVQAPGRGAAIEASVLGQVAALKARAARLRAMRPSGLPTSELYAQMEALRARAGALAGQ